MKKLAYSDLKNQIIIDVRSQYDFQNGHIQQALNLNPANFKTYAKDFLKTDQAIVFIVEDEEGLDELSLIAKEAGFTEVSGYLLASDVPNEELQKVETISANAFFKVAEEYTLLDVRHPDEITRPAPEENLVNIPLKDLSENVESLDKEKRIYTLCGSGNRGTSAASYLASKGYEPVVIEGGMKNFEELR